MKKYIYMAVAAIAALSSCSNEDEIVANENGKGETTFFATMEKDATTRVALSGKTPSWESGDAISIDGHAYTAAADVASTGAFTGEGATEATHHAYYPASMYSKVGEVVTITLPASYVYTADKFDMPMYAESTTTELSFKNLCGVLAITVPSTQMSTVTSIVVSSDKQMNGVIDNVTAEGVLTFASATPLPDANKKVTLTAASPISIPAEGKTFYIPVPANTHNPLLITVSNGTDTKTMVTKKSGGVVVARNTIYPIDFAGTPLGAWESKLTLGKSAATSIVIETDVTTLPTAVDGTHKKLNSAGTVWEVLDGTTLKIQTSAAKIKGHGPFGDDGLFDGYKNVTTITGLANIDFSEVTDMRFMFYGCNALTSLDLSGFNTSAVTDMEFMFVGCYALTSLNLSGFNTSAVTKMKSMFNNCNALTSLDLSSFNTSAVTDMYEMFNNCNALTSLDLSSFNTSAVTSMYEMFNNCNALTSLVLSDNFVMTNVTNKGYMFNCCGNSSTKCTVSGATGDKETPGDVKYELSHGTQWNDARMTFE